MEMSWNQYPFSCLVIHIFTAGNMPACILPKALESQRHSCLQEKAKVDLVKL